MEKPVVIIGGGLAGSEAALQLAARGIPVVLYEMRPVKSTAVHKTADFAELVCSNSLKSTKAETAAGMQKLELEMLGSKLYVEALSAQVPAGGALAVDRVRFAGSVTKLIEDDPLITVVREEVASLDPFAGKASALVLATGPLTSDSLAESLSRFVAGERMAFYDAAAPIVMADSLDRNVLFCQSRYEDATDADGNPLGDYLNAPFTKEEYEAFVDELLGAELVIKREFESKDLFQACQPIEEIARAGRDAPRFGPLKPVGLTDPRTGKRPWAVLQLRAEDASGTCYNMVGFQTNLKFSEQKRIFSMIPGMENAEFVRYGVMHRNTFLDAPRVLTPQLRVKTQEVAALGIPVYVAGQLGGTEGYCEAIRSGLHVALNVAALLKGVEAPTLPRETAFGSLLAYATDPATKDYQPMHVNFGIFVPLDTPIRNKRERYAAYSARGESSLRSYCEALVKAGLMEEPAESRPEAGK